MIHVNYTACHQIASFFTRYNPPRLNEEIKLKSDLTPNEIANFYLFVVAICHQTSPVGQEAYKGEINGRELVGWDYLVAKFMKRVEDSHPSKPMERIDKQLSMVLNPKFWARMDMRDFLEIFGDGLSDKARRIELIQDLGKKMVEYGYESFMNYPHRSNNDLVLEFLSKFEAYRDPVQKKSLLLLALLTRDYPLWSMDKELLPPVDYHETRGHLRLGTVWVENEKLASKLYNMEEVTEEEDILIRLCVSNAIALIGSLSGVFCSDLHYFFWNFFRNVCTRNDPKCHGSSYSNLPQELRDFLSHRFHKCPFSFGACASANKERKMVEHQHTTDFY